MRLLLPYLHRRLWLIAAGLAFWVAGPAHAANNNFFYNTTDHDVYIQREDSDRKRDAVRVNAGGDDGADMSGGEVRLRVWTVDSDDKDFFCIVKMPEAGSAYLREEQRVRWMTNSLGVGIYPPNLYCETRSSSGDRYDISSFGIGAHNRNVRFVISADCHYNLDWDNPKTPNGVEERQNADGVNFHMRYRCETQPEVRGIIYAGDLTFYGHARDVQDYLDSFGDRDNLRFVFDGYGNHDHYTQGDQDWNGLRNHIQNQKRVTPKTNKGASGQPHYSWDWHDVHFVQLNLVAGHNFTPKGGELELDPLDSFDFLVSDLAAFVGNSGRPVVLIQHYGWDGLSLNDNPDKPIWWIESQRVELWNAIKNYNVIAIFAGHAHPTPEAEGWDNLWSRPAGATGGPDVIPTFTSGAAQSGAFLDVWITDSDIYIERNNRFGQVAQVDIAGTLMANTKTFCLPRRFPIHVDQSNTSTGGGSAVAPYNKLDLAVSVLDCATNSVDVKIAAGDYKQNVRLNRPLRLLPQGGPVRVGRP